MQEAKRKKWSRGKNARGKNDHRDQQGWSKAIWSNWVSLLWYTWGRQLSHTAFQGNTAIWLPLCIHETLFHTYQVNEQEAMRTSKLAAQAKDSLGRDVSWLWSWTIPVQCQRTSTLSLWKQCQRTSTLSPGNIRDTLAPTSFKNSLIRSYTVS